MKDFSTESTEDAERIEGIPYFLFSVVSVRSASSVLASLLLFFPSLRFNCLFSLKRSACGREWSAARRAGGWEYGAQ